MTAIRIRPRADDESLPWNTEVDYKCQWRGCRWHNTYYVVERDGTALGAACTEHRVRSPEEWAEVLP